MSDACFLQNAIFWLSSTTHSRHSLASGCYVCDTYMYIYYMYFWKLETAAMLYGISSFLWRDNSGRVHVPLLYCVLPCLDWAILQGIVQPCRSFCWGYSCLEQHWFTVIKNQIYFLGQFIVWASFDDAMCIIMQDALPWQSCLYALRCSKRGRGTSHPPPPKKAPGSHRGRTTVYVMCTYMYDCIS